jgi:hypothetical protein
LVRDPSGGGDPDFLVRLRRRTVTITHVTVADDGGDRDDRRAERDADADRSGERGRVHRADAHASADPAASDRREHDRGDPHEDSDPATEWKDGIH